MFALYALIFLVHSTHAAETPPPSAPNRQEFCRVLLDADHGRDLQLAAQFTTARPLLIENLQSVVNQLIEEGTITPAQASDYFAESLLGAFSPIFSRYVIAELLSRRYASPEIPDFIIHFDRMFTPERQVDFAIAVARRMLLTVNDDPGHDSPEGVKNFKTAFKSLGVDAQTYGHFLQTWRFVRSSQPETILKFILINIKNVGHIIEQQTPPEPKPRPAQNWSFLTSFWPRGDSSNSSVPSILNVGPLPKKILELSEVPPATTEHSYFRRFFDDTANAAASYLNRFDGLPPFTHEYFLSRDLSSLTFAQLRALKDAKIVRGLSDTFKESMTKELEEFGHFGALIKRATDLDTESARRFEERLRPVTEPDSIRVAAFLEEFSQGLGNLSDKSMKSSQRSILVNESLNKTYRHFRADPALALTSADFMAIANGTINQIFTLRYFFMSKSLIDALMAMSQDFTLTVADAELIKRTLMTHSTNRFVDGQLVREVPISSDPEMASILVVDHWGRRPIRPTHDSVAESAELRQTLEDIAKILGRHGEATDNLRGLLLKILKFSLEHA